MRRPRTAPREARWRASDGYSLAGRVWPGPPGAPVCLYLHGIQSHGGWYEWSGALLAACGWTVVMPDRRGSGLNSAARGDAPDRRRWLADLDEVLEQEAPGAGPVGLAGISWGGKLAAAWAATRPQRVGRLLLVTPGIYPRVDVGAWRRLGIAAALLSAQPRRSVPIPLSDTALFTANPAGRAFIESDPLKLERATARFLFCSSRLDAQVRRLPAGALAMPTTLLLAGQDRIIDNARTEAWLRRVAGGAARVETLAEAHHTLEFEEVVSAYERLLREWAQSP